VTATTPSSAKRDTTLNVTISGSGFEQGSRAVWALDGDTTFTKTKVKTNSTTYVTPKQIVANITIAADATVDLYDVQVVTLSGRKGIGIELFAITLMNDLGVLGDSLQSVAYDVNDGGTAVGYAHYGPYFSSNPHAVKWTPTGTTWTITDLAPQLGTGVNLLRAINANGDMVGATSPAATQFHAFVLSAAGALTILAEPPGLTHSEAYDINASGEVVGTTWNTTDPPDVRVRPFYWSAATGMVVLPPLPGATVSAGGAAAINDDGVIAGSTTDGVGGFAVRWQRVGGVWTVSKLPSGDGMGPTAISNNGNIVGTGCRPNVSPCVRRAYFWPAGGGRIELGTLGGTESMGNGVNDAGRVVGQSFTKTGYTRGFVWTMSDGMKELSVLGNVRSVAWAQGISNAGMIVGASSYSNVREDSPWHATLWMVP
jgi:probable HAF family extracellular repeat protein